MGAHCGHSTTEKYLETEPLGCCATCANALGTDGAKQAPEKLEAIRHNLSVHCPKCRRDVEPLARAEVLLGVFWGKLELDEAKYLTLRAHNRHAHTSYDQDRFDLEAKGDSGKDARSILRYGEDGF